MQLDSPSGRLKFAREQHGKYATPTAAARAFGWPVSTYLGHENGDRNPSRAAARRYAQRYGVRWEWLLDGEGVAIAASKVPVAGNVLQNSEIEFFPKEQIDSTAELPPGGSARTLALQVTEGSMRGIADDHWLIYFDNEQRPPTTELLGKLCVVGLDDKAVMLRTLQPGRRKGHYDLESPVHPTLRDRRVRWAARVTWIRPR